ncbi:hypothetical protein [Paraflavitalea speifideaquila]|uniref:hypothetical protein n=1 Tax=Paraflavitalea speifideaquila TaxID=3076558 RepID=UPI0028E98329|nr:hypothetical protein [Paraflavitalea speifideiaquila]
MIDPKEQAAAEQLSPELPAENTNAAGQEGEAAPKRLLSNLVYAYSLSKHKPRSREITGAYKKLNLKAR